jgi:hypothetical protein
VRASPFDPFASADDPVPLRCDRGRLRQRHELFVIWVNPDGTRHLLTACEAEIEEACGVARKVLPRFEAAS